MTRKRFIIETGTGVDLHGENATEAACRAVSDAISDNCLCGLTEVLEPEQAKNIQVEILIATPNPGTVDADRVGAMAPIGETSVQVVEGGMKVPGLMSERFGPGKDQILVANAAVTVYVG